MHNLFSSSAISEEWHVASIRSLIIESKGEVDLVDFDEMFALPEIRQRIRMWFSGQNALAAFAFVDLYDNLVFSVDPEVDLGTVGPHLVEWGETLARRIAQEKGEPAVLDCVCKSKNLPRQEMLKRNGFVEQPVRSLVYAMSLDQPVQPQKLPEGFFVRHVAGIEEAAALAALHRACFGSEIMTTEYRLAMMQTSVYDQSLDLVVEAENGDLVAFCVCSLEHSQDGSGLKIGYPDPIGVHPDFQQRGIGKALLNKGLRLLQQRGARSANLGTSSENLEMQKLAETAGFSLVSEKIWFRKESIQSEEL